MAIFRKTSNFAGRLGATALLSGLMLSCSSLNPFGWAQSAVTIAELSQPTAERRVVEIQGKVINVAPFLTGGAYQIQDDTGTIWVRGNGPLPQKGAVVTLKGELTSEAIFIGAEKLAESYLLEIDPPRAGQARLQTTEDREQITEGAGEISTSAPAVVPSPVQTPAPAASPSPKPQAPLVNPNVNPNVAAPKPSPTPNPQPSTPTAQPIAVDPPPSVPVSPPPAAPIPSKPKPSLNVDDEFLPHKQLDKP
ncbi:MAG: hypothetical protein GC158_10075 [Cyanobacteria bacterium RI_101]|nr:hypothetical protein [Cyanobacteria bacterium RI_101]